MAEDPAATGIGRSWHEIFYTSRDGLRLHVRHYPAPGSTKRPVVCLPGLTRNARDFHEIAIALSQAARSRRDVYCVDYRGRGRSETDPDWRNYTPLTECNDVLDFITLQGLDKPALIGTSRGGIIAMVMAVLRPAAFGPVVLNDIGPVIEREGLMRIAGYVGRTPLPADWPEAVQRVKSINGRQFPALGEADWLRLTRAIYDDVGGLPGSAYDPALAKVLAASNTSEALPEMWPQFQALGHVPVQVLRGELSDLLAPRTVQRMAELHPALEAHTVRGQGHAPLLMDEPTVALVADFIGRHDAGRARLQDVALNAVA